jgi:thiol-disulfide isomerase/thioredoxin
LLAFATLPVVKTSIYKRILAAAILAKDNARAVKYGEMLLKVDRNDVTTLRQLARVLADGKKDLNKALHLSERAVELTKEYRPPQPRASAKNGEKVVATGLPEAFLREIYDGERARVLNSRAFVLFVAGKYDEAEALLRQSLKHKHTAGTYSQLEATLLKLGRADEAAIVAAEGEIFWKKEILANFKNEPSKDFELTTIKNGRVKLSALKGKIVMVNFWATWCAPCIEEMPVLVELYDKYKSQGLEILAISVDAPDVRQQIPMFAAKHRMNFPVLYDENAAALYGVNSYPTTLFVDRQGNLRYRTKGLDVKNARRDLEFIVSELLNDKS